MILQTFILSDSDADSNCGFCTHTCCLVLIWYKPKLYFDFLLSNSGTFHWAEETGSGEWRKETSWPTTYKHQNTNFIIAICSGDVCSPNMCNWHKQHKRGPTLQCRRIIILATYHNFSHPSRLTHRCFPHRCPMPSPTCSSRISSRTVASIDRTSCLV